MTCKNLLPIETLLAAFAMFIYPTVSVVAQNLVPNGDFEAYNSCPALTNGGNGSTSYVSIEHSPAYTIFPTVKGWVNPVSHTTPDYLNSCASASVAASASTPVNYWGRQMPHSGNGYVGLFSFNGGSVEYVSAKLQRPLVKDSIYRVALFVSPAELPVGIGGSTVTAVNEFGAYLSDVVPDNQIDYRLNLLPTISNDTNRHLSDTTKWYEITGNYSAKGGEQWITIGCFTGNNYVPANTVIVSGNPTTIGYHYVDDVSVVPTGKRGVTSVKFSRVDGVSLSPNPAKDFIQIDGLPGGDKFVTLVGMDGKELNQQPVSANSARIDVSLLAQGIYILRVYSNVGVASFRISK